MYRFIGYYLAWLILSCLIYYEFLMSLQKFFGVPNRSWTLHDYAFGLILANTGAFVMAGITMALVSLFKRIRRSWHK